MDWFLYNNNTVLKWVYYQCCEFLKSWVMSNCSQVLKPLPIWLIVQYYKYSSAWIQITLPWWWCWLSRMVLDNRDTNLFSCFWRTDKNFRNTGWHADTWPLKLRCLPSTLLLACGNSSSVLLNMFQRIIAKSAGRLGAFLRYLPM